MTLNVGRRRSEVLRQRLRTDGEPIVIPVPKMETVGGQRRLVTPDLRGIARGTFQKFPAPSELST